MPLTLNRDVKRVRLLVKLDGAGMSGESVANAPLNPLQCLENSRAENFLSNQTSGPQSFCFNRVSSPALNTVRAHHMISFKKDQVCSVPSNRARIPVGVLH
jgi:hypothetical protein